MATATLFNLKMTKKNTYLAISHQSLFIASLNFLPSGAHLHDLSLPLILPH